MGRKTGSDQTMGMQFVRNEIARPKTATSPQKKNVPLRSYVFGFSVAFKFVVFIALFVLGGGGGVDLLCLLNGDSRTKALVD